MEQAPPSRRDQWFWIAGLALPALVVAFFLAARFLPRLWVDPPAFDAVYQVPDHGFTEGSREVHVSVVEGRLRARWVRRDEPSYQGVPAVYRYEAATGETRRVEIPEPEPADWQGEKDVFVELGAPLRPEVEAPDGYEFRTGSSGRGGGLFSEIFLDHSSSGAPSLHKGGRVVPLPTFEPGRYVSADFLGWLVPEDAPR